MKKVLLLCVVFVTMHCFGSDVLTLNNQLKFEGKVTKVLDCDIVFKSNGEKYLVPIQDIFSINFENANGRQYRKFSQMGDGGENYCMNGRLDAEAYHGKKGGHFALGFLFGPFAMIGTALANPSPYNGKRTAMLSKNKEQFSNLEYLSCYKKRAKGQLIGMEALGWGAWIILILVI